MGVGWKPYGKQVLRILLEIGDGAVSVQSLAKHVYNMNCTLFTQPDLQEIHNYVQQFLLRNSKSPQSFIERTGRRGYYRLKPNKTAVVQRLVLELPEQEDDVEQQKEEKPQQDLSLCLFDF